jgi:DNA-binding beta-propeller fold protein YncE
MKSIIVSCALVALCAAANSRAQAQAPQMPLQLEWKIPLGEVRGRIDHMAVDLARRRLFVAELENDSVGVVDLDMRKVIHVITDAKSPQGLGYLPSADMLYVANGGDGVLRVFEGEGYRAVKRMQLGDDADNVRIDAVARQILVAYGDGALAVINATSWNRSPDIALASHPESFQLDRSNNRIFVNEPKMQAITVVDRAAGKSIAAWKTQNSSNFAMALNEESNHVLAVYRTPAKLVGFAAATGAVAASQDTCGDADDMFVDAKRRKVYVSCGEGFVDVFDAQAGRYERVSHIATMSGARTSLFVPEMDRLFVAARATLQEPAAIWVFRSVP